jgi:hypothetical protein
MANTTVRIDCVNKAKEHSHITSVGHIDRDAHTATTKTYTVADVYTALDALTVFYTVSPTDGKIALVHKYTCKEANCGFKTLKSAADAVKDNNLDNLPGCS